MNNDEYVSFLKGVLVKIENALNLMGNFPPKHILAYHKMLGVQQKIVGLDNLHRNQLFPQIIHIRGIINHLINGHYKKAHEIILKLKGHLINICLEIENEKNRDKKT